MKKIMAVLIGILMLMVYVSVSLAGTNTIKVAEIPLTDSLGYTWTEYNDSDWSIVAGTDTDYVYRCSNDDMRWSIPTEGVTDYRGMVTARVNVSTIDGDRPYYGLIFNYVNDSAFLYVGLTTHDSSDWWEIGWWNGSAHQLMEVAVNTSNVNVSANWSVLKCIYNPWVGQILFKAWDTTRTEPAKWDIDYADDSNLSVIDSWVDSTTQWGLYTNGTNDVIDFWGIGIYDLHYDVRDIRSGDADSYVPWIDCPHIGEEDMTADMFDTTNFINLVTAWNLLDQQSFPVYSLVSSGYPKGNVYVFSAWNYTEDKIGFLIYDDNDDVNSSSDWLAFTVDKNYNRLLDAGDKFFFFDKSSDPTSYTYNGSAWVAASDTISFEWGFDATGITRYSHTQWSIIFDASSILPSDMTTAEFADGNNYVGLGIWSDLPAWAWNNWDEIDNATRGTLGVATDGAWNDTLVDWEETGEGQPRDGNLSYLGDFSLTGWTTPSTEAEYVNLADLDSKYGVSYTSWIWHINRYALNAEQMGTDNITKIKVPTTSSKEFLFGLLRSSVTVSEVKFYGVTIADFSRVELSATSGSKQNYTIKASTIADYDVIVVVLNPSMLDTNNWFFKWLYSDDVGLAL